MAISQRTHHFLSPPPPLASRLHTFVFELQRWMHSSSGKEGNTVDSILPPTQVGHDVTLSRDDKVKESSFGSSFDPLSWRTIDSRVIGIERSAVPSFAWTVLNILQKAGYDAYLVGGCVRDLCLKRTPKDFDVITDATLKQVKKQFRHCLIVGRRYPICHVHLKGSIVEVSTFKTDDDNVKNGEDAPSQIPNRCTVKDYIRWKNCLRRDFTINCLFFDPIRQCIYDYVSGLKDLRISKVRTVIPADLSFEEDCARILRGLRIAARLGFQFSRETASAIRDFSSSILSLNAARLQLEMNFMLAYGAAESSIYALQKFKLLDILLPIQATYLADQRRKKVGHDFNMLMKLFSTADKYFSTDRPANGKLWSAIMAFHLALVENPQDSLVVWTFSTILYRGTWNNAIEIAKQNERVHHVQFIPEIHASINPKSNEEILEEVSHLASLIKTSVNSLTSIDALEKSLGRYGNPPSSRMLITSKRMGKDVATLFDVLESKIKSYNNKREGCQINYELLKKGNADEIRFVLGKIIMETMNSKSSDGQSQIEHVQSHNHPQLSSLFK
ncbi:poly(A) polymerase I-like isoform X3 [Zingiber officinale]|uniref:poly(A) polymerase I-like isoform X2 n=1 Tax=Zingiber officinale TaxID=94328 RepID=UPI001C4D2B38|nr:poly(A) polymerase I-like isoform X2 [Zingiber officinale]XP_042470530.1 poly(A) polymerase I-like isoform X3 [Zingiber officinale]